jgi:hypothetical protein
LLIFSGVCPILNLQGCKAIDYEGEGFLNNDIDKEIYSEKEILQGKIGVEFSRKHMKFYDYVTGKENMNKKRLELSKKIIQEKTGIDPIIFKGGKKHIVIVLN